MSEKKKKDSIGTHGWKSRNRKETMCPNLLSVQEKIDQTVGHQGPSFSVETPHNNDGIIRRDQHKHLTGISSGFKLIFA